MSEALRIESVTRLLDSYVFNVERRRIRQGDATFDRDVVTHPGGVAILVRDHEGRIGVLRQWRSAFGAFLWEIPAGTQDVEDEDPLTTAKRELREELGCEATTWTELGRFMVSSGWTDQVMTIFEAVGITIIERAPEGPEEMSSEVHWFTPDALRQTLRGEPAIESTMAVALNRVFGTFFDHA